MNRYKVIYKPTGVKTIEAESMEDLMSSLDTEPFMIVATTKIENKDEPYQAIQYNGKVQINGKSGAKSVLANTISEALSEDSEVEEEYVLLTAPKRPKDWDENYSSYYIFYKGNYLPVSSAFELVYTPAFESDKYYYSDDGNYILLTSQPEDWGTGIYYTKSGTEEEPVYQTIEFHTSQIEVAPQYEPNKYYEKQE